jgi:2-oxo-4-hydroxy-4-carboxy--5-ureidoimidazoline (OHCU) decarboxylase
LSVAVEQGAHSVAALNAFPAPAFAAAMAPFFEGAPRFLARLAAARPFSDETHLFERASGIALGMPEDEQLELIDAHPRIGAPPDTVSAMSFVEQGYSAGVVTPESATAMLDRAGLQARLDALNSAYEDRFGFRFVVFVAGRPRSEIAALMEQRLRGERDVEKRTALEDIVAIARDRWRKAAVSAS